MRMPIRFDASDQGRMRRLATYASIAVAAVLIVAKLAAYLFTDSITLLSSLLDSTVDLLSSAVTAIGVASALKPPDHDHRFGHGKAEPLAALTQAAFIIGSSVLLAYQAINRLYHPQVVENEHFGVIVMILSIALTVALLQFQRFVVRQTHSMAIGADRMHYSVDLYLNVAVLAALFLYRWSGKEWVDPAFAFAIALFMSFNATRIGRDALNVLMDKELSDNDHARIRGIVESHPHVTSLSRIRTRSDSDRVFMELHVEMDGAMPLNAAHRIGDALTESIRQAYPNADVLIHEDPTGLAARGAVAEGFS